MRRLSLIAGLALLGACSTPPKPAELEAFERLRADPATGPAAKKAPEMMSRADRLLGEARKSWEDGDLDDSRNAALMGQIKLKQALAIYEQDRAKARIKQADADQTASNEALASVTKDLTAINEQIGLLKKLQAEAAEREKLTQQLTTQEQKASAEKQNLEQKALAVDKMSGAELALKEAETVNAAKYAPVPFSSAVDMLTRAQKEFSEANFMAAATSAELAKNKAKEAADGARPQYQQEAASAENKAKAEALARDAASMTRFEVRRDARGALQRLILHIPATELFVKKETSIAGGRDQVLQSAADLIQKYPGYPVQIVGYTDSRGKADGLLALSLARAQAVFSALIQRGVDAKRMIVSGQGSSEPISDNKSASGRARNNRIELIFLYQ